MMKMKFLKKLPTVDIDRVLYYIIILWLSTYLLLIPSSQYLYDKWYSIEWVTGQNVETYSHDGEKLVADYLACFIVYDKENVDARLYEYGFLEHLTSAVVEGRLGKHLMRDAVNEDNWDALSDYVVVDFFDMFDCSLENRNGGCIVNEAVVFWDFKFSRISSVSECCECCSKIKN